ncbi:uncharacterized protein LOC114351483 [Ostrinia furnacalis]|uniref:uncharacterized protein LOC114351483 n=1 Tax=Ostrinia furnacalis TaxID=93504 RepID=UPI00103C996A|nr:uncharacterized protein LOC114351483 [Ostrinia furnacalis]
MNKNIEYVVLLSAVLLITRNVDAQTEFDTRNIANGEYSYMYEDDFQSKSETAKHDDQGDLKVKGQYKYVVDNKQYTITYTSDKDGYHAKVAVVDLSQSDYNEDDISDRFGSEMVLASLVGK